MTNAITTAAARAALVLPNWCFPFFPLEVQRIALELMRLNGGKGQPLWPAR